MFFFSTIVRGECIEEFDNGVNCVLIAKINYGAFSECWFSCSNLEGLLKLVIRHLDSYGTKVLFGNLDGKLARLNQVIDHPHMLSADPVLEGEVIIESVREQAMTRLYDLLGIASYIKVFPRKRIAKVKLKAVRTSDLFKLAFRVLKPWVAPPKPKLLTESASKTKQSHEPSHKP